MKDDFPVAHTHRFNKTFLYVWAGQLLLHRTHILQMAHIHQIFSGCICTAVLTSPTSGKRSTISVYKNLFEIPETPKASCHNLLDIFLLQLIAVKRQTFDIVFFFLPAAQFLSFHSIRPDCIHHNNKWLANLF